MQKYFAKFLRYCSLWNYSWKKNPKMHRTLRAYAWVGAIASSLKGLSIHI